jgi:hypothetical protein
MFEVAAEATVKVLPVETLNVFIEVTLDTKKFPLNVAPAAFELIGVPGMRPCASTVVTITLDAIAEIEATGIFD